MTLSEDYSQIVLQQNINLKILDMKISDLKPFKKHNLLNCFRRAMFHIEGSLNEYLKFALKPQNTCTIWILLCCC